MSNPFHIIIPSRYASVRLPGKAMADIAGKPMIARVIEQCLLSDARSVVVATDDVRIREAALGAGADAVMTSDSHRSGSDRIAEAVGILNLGDDEIVVNVQGDEPSMPPALINRVAEALSEPGGHAMSTAVAEMERDADMADPSVVKAVVDARGDALYFSRAPIPFSRDRADQAVMMARRHIGIYGYRAGYIRQFAARAPSPLEETERLEQLRALWHGDRIRCVEAGSLPEFGVDTEQDLESVRRRYEAGRRG
ncbi:MAG: 3-deoxy-manno-octulosonate cytidylyltransferase [Gammaproteobacteria bacterium]|nr:3-deoxy-manno-octulosonate cytidylyltransferase [Gammaproteobacteria bacterium]MYD75894.1 3-deoxy-manno-octulosonate cytidylyltransferase [Gammaproteobacteria bacterium]MYJ53084.1 3-deoxy-manno-octulosonate cytidylyltransferase [Gammaproteobacteria bacterium]